MKRAIPLFVVLVTVLSVLLYLKLRQQRLEAERPSGGSATVEGTRVDVVSRLPGRIRVIKVAAGDRVEQGQVLAELECAEQRAMLAQAEAGLEGARIGLEASQTGEALAKEGIRGAAGQLAVAKAAADAAKAKKEADEVQRGAAERASKRVQEVHNAGAVSDQALDQSETQLLGLDHQLSAVGASLDSALARTITASSAKQAALIQTKLASAEIRGAAQKLAAAQAARDQAATAVAECSLLAPRDGIVQERNFEPGEVVLPGSRVLTLVDIREVKATFYLPNAELRAAKPGVEVELRADTYGAQLFRGHVSHVAVEAEFTPRNVQTREDRDRLVYAVETTVPNPDGLLRPGMPVEILIPGTGKGAR
jgi:HlyD family secretion protein